MMHNKQIVLIAFSALFVSSMAAECQDNWRQIRKRLTASRKKFAKTAPTPGCYNMTLEKQCFCPPEWRGPHDIQVKGNKIQNTTMYTKDLPTIEGLFDLVEKHCVTGCPSSGAASCTVRFDKQYGHVKSVWIDISEQMADEEIGYYVSDVSFCGSN